MIYRPLCVARCDDCGKFPIMVSEGISIFIVDNEFYGILRCLHCDRIINDTMTKETAINLFWDNVIIFNWNDGSQVSDQKILEKI